MTALATALTTVAALLIVAAGAAKLARPSPAVDAMLAVGLRTGTTVVRVLAAGEVGVGTAVVVTTSPLARTLLALVYVGFAGFVLVSMHRGVAASCGCFGSEGGPLGWRHVVVDLVLATGVAVTLTARMGPITSSAATLDGGAALAVACVSTLLAAAVLTRGRVA